MIIPRGRKSQEGLPGLKSRCRPAGLCSSGGTGGGSLPCLFRLPEAACAPWLPTPPARAPLLPMSHLFLCPSCLPFSLVMVLAPPTPPRIIQSSPPASGSLVSSHLQSPVCHIRRHSHRPGGLGHGRLWRGCHSVSPRTSHLLPCYTGDPEVDETHPKHRTLQAFPMGTVPGRIKQTVSQRNTSYLGRPAGPQGPLLPDITAQTSQPLNDNCCSLITHLVPGTGLSILFILSYLVLRTVL